LRTAIGIDIGGTKISGGVITSDGEVRLAAVRPTPAHEGAEAVLGATARLIEDLLMDCSAPIAGIGVGAAGQVNAEAGVIAYANDNLPGWTGTPVRDVISQTTGMPVVVENDVNVMAYAEYRLLADPLVTHALFITVGTGVGGALITQGALWRGAHWSAGEVGYLPTRDGFSIESVASGPALTRRYAALTGEQLPLRQIAQRALTDPIARQVISEGAAVLGESLAPIVCLLDPHCVIVGGGVPQIGDLWWDAFIEALHDSPLPAVRDARVLPARLGVNAGMVGAGLLALDLLKGTV
jgi:glucokinase